MTRVLAFPLRLAGNGSLATVEQGSAAHAAQIALAAAVTRPGERPLSPLYGSVDPAGGDDLSVVAAGIEASEPGLLVDEIASQINADGTADLTLRVRWEDS
jgi:hypothetical protein